MSEFKLGVRGRREKEEILGQVWKGLFKLGEEERREGFGGLQEKRFFFLVEMGRVELNAELLYLYLFL